MPRKTFKKQRLAVAERCAFVRCETRGGEAGIIYTSEVYLATEGRGRGGGEGCTEGGVVRHGQREKKKVTPMCVFTVEEMSERDAYKEVTDRDNKREMVSSIGEQEECSVKS